MNYIKLKKVVTEHTTLSLVHSEEEQAYRYAEEGEFEYWGVATEDENFLAKQHAECEAEELTFAQIQSILNNCKLMKDINQLIEKEIAKKYTLAEELGLTNTNWDTQEYFDYRTYVDECKAKFLPMKVERGLVEDGV